MFYCCFTAGETEVLNRLCNLCNVSEIALRAGAPGLQPDLYSHNVYASMGEAEGPLLGWGQFQFFCLVVFIISRTANVPVPSSGVAGE